MIKNADIEIDGITIIAGENNSGKSTVSKVLYSVFNSFYQIYKKISMERIDVISRIISSSFHREGIGFMLSMICAEKITNEINKNKSKYRNDINLLQSYITSMLIQNNETLKKHIKKIDFKRISEKIIQVFNVSDNEIHVTTLHKMMQLEFSDQIVNLNNTDNNGEIILRIKGEEVKITFSSNGETTVGLSGVFDLNTEIIYIDDPFVIDNFRYRPRVLTQYLEHREHLALKLVREIFDEMEGNRIPRNTIDHIITSKKLECILEKINNVCSGDFVRKDLSMAYKESKSGNVYNMTNISTGIKTFFLLKVLLLNGSIEENGTIILDEPESHLHPEWQLLFAEIIVLLQKDFNLHILINTHSPYFLNAIEVHSYNHGIHSRCKYYLAENIDNSSVISDVSNNIEKIYEKLARPLQDLENMRYLND
jgi:predicted ATPase